MNYVIMVSHGTLAEGMQVATSMMTGERDDVRACCLKPGMSTDAFGTEFEKTIVGIHSDDSIILLADILSGSPFTKALEILANQGLMQSTLVIAGMNMPLALTAILQKDNIDSLAELKELLLKEGQNGIVDFSLEEEDSDEEEDI